MSPDPITNEDEYDSAVTKLNALLDIQLSRDLTTDEREHLEQLGALIETWDEAVQRIPPPDLPEGTDEHLQRFLDLARSSKSNPMEIAAQYMASSATDFVHALDESSLRGFVAFCGICKVSPTRARQLLED